MLASLKRTWNGKEKPWKVFWLWGVLGTLFYLVFFILAFNVFLPTNLEDHKDTLLLILACVWYIQLVYLGIIAILHIKYALQNKQYIWCLIILLALQYGQINTSGVIWSVTSPLITITK